MDAIIMPELEVNTAADLERLLELCAVEMQHSSARMEELDRRFEQTLTRIDERGKQIDHILHHVQAN